MAGATSGSTKGLSAKPTRAMRDTRLSSTQELENDRSDTEDNIEKLQVSQRNARTWLEENQFIDEDEDEVDIDTLRGVLLHLSTLQKLPVKAREGMRAVAYCLIKAEWVEMKKQVHSAVETAVETQREALESWAEATVKTVQELGEKVKERVEEMQRGQGRGGEGEGGGGEGGDTRGETGAWSTLTQARTGAHTSYADAAHQAEHDEMVHRTKTRVKQILIDALEGSTAMKDLSEKELILKAEMARETMGICGLDGPNVKFTSVRKLRNGGALYEVDTEEAAEWLLREDVRKVFLEKYGAGASMKDRTFTVLVEFVPTTLGDNPNEGMRWVEESNNLQPGEMANARWIRAPHMRTDPNQKSAHLIIACATREGANNLISKGLVIEGKRVSTRKLDQEPCRCLKCQLYGKGHLASECKQIKETCGMCAKEHRTKDCKENDPTKFACVSCKAKGWRYDHPSSARTCPTFIEAKSRLTERTPELKYRFYPTDDPKTWERMDSKSSKVGAQREASRGREPEGGRRSGQGRLVGGELGQGGGGTRNWADEMEEARTEAGGREGGKTKKTNEDISSQKTTLDRFLTNTQKRSKKKDDSNNSETREEGEVEEDVAFMEKDDWERMMSEFNEFSKKMEEANERRSTSKSPNSTQS